MLLGTLMCTDRPTINKEMFTQSWIWDNNSKNQKGKKSRHNRYLQSSLLYLNISLAQRTAKCSFKHNKWLRGASQHFTMFRLWQPLSPRVSVEPGHLQSFLGVMWPTDLSDGACIVPGPTPLSRAIGMTTVKILARAFFSTWMWGERNSGTECM